MIEFFKKYCILYKSCSKIIETFCLFSFLIDIFGWNLLDTLNIVINNLKIVNQLHDICMNILFFHAWKVWIAGTVIDHN
jgi:hypothetical protein